MEAKNSNINSTLNYSIDFKSIFFKYIRYWYLFVITIPIGLIGGYIKSKYTKPLFEISTTLLLKDDQNGMSSKDKDVLKELNLFSTSVNIKNEIEILRSNKMAAQTANAMNIQVAYFKEKKTYDIEVYTTSPFIVKFDTSQHELPYNKKFQIIPLSQREYNLVSEDIPSLNGKYYFGQLLKYKDFKFTLVANSKWQYSFQKQNYFFYFVSPLSLCAALSSLKIELRGKDITVVQLTLTGQNLHKSVDVLNTLTRVYMEKSLEKKNQKAINTIQFINEQLAQISDSLNITESRLQDFKSGNMMINLSRGGQTYIDQMNLLESQKSVNLIQIKYLEYLKKYINDNKKFNELCVPSTMGIQDDLLNELISQLIIADAQLQEVQYSSKRNNKIIDKINFKILTLKHSIFENLNNLLTVNNISLNDLVVRQDSLDRTIRKLPVKERELLGIERKFKLNDDIYTYLLEKRSEAAIAKASNVPDSEVIDEASISRSQQLEPQKTKSLLVGFGIGLIIPIIFLYLRVLFNDKIKDKTDIGQLTNHSVLGYIIHSFSASTLAVVEKPKSSIAESFRALRTNMHFLTPDNLKQIILVTSSHTGEGKTFTTINLGCILALSGRKTIILGFDLRKPRLYQDFGLTNHVGISSYLAGKNVLTDVIQKTQVESLDLITAGPIPPNPAELIALPKTKLMLEELLKTYDYIVLDTSPIGIVADAFFLMQMSNINLFVIRHNVSTKKMTERVLEDIDLNNIKNLSIVVNDISSNAYSYGYKYNYGYRYNYGYYSSYGYYEEEKVVSSWVTRVYDNIKNNLKE